jgi:two-component system response regulator RegA
MTRRSRRNSLESPKKKILLIDDDEWTIRRLAIVFPDNSLDVVHAKSSAAGLSMLERDPKYDLIILDIRMPGESGIDCLSALVNMHIRIPVLVFSSLNGWRPCRSSLKKGARDYLAKECDNRELRAVVEELTAKIG